MSIEVHRYPTAESFLARVEPVLLAAEAENNLILGIAADLVAHPNRHREPPPYFASVETDGQIEACALFAPPFPLAVSRSTSPALEALAADLAAVRPDLFGAIASVDTVRVFGEMWSRRTGAAVEPGMRQRIYQLDRVEPPPAGQSGHLRPATVADLPQVEAWFEAFIAEAGMHPPPDAHVEAREKVDNGMVYLWQDKEPVTMAAWAGRTANGARLNYVYTPPEHRGRGYASACVAALSQHLLDNGCTVCFLFTDLANPTSNRLYQRLGYRPVCDVAEVLFAD